MQGILPSQVPTSGRYDFILRKSGNSRGNARKEIPSRQIIHAVIDNGPFQGKRVSSQLSEGEVTDLLALFEAQGFVLPPNPGFGDLARGVGTVRFSATLTVSRQALMGEGFVDVGADYNATNVYCSYSLSDYLMPVHNSELAGKFVREGDKFKR